MKTSEEERYRRQENQFSSQRRRGTVVCDVCAESSELASRFGKIGESLAGVPKIASDFHGHAIPGCRASSGRHWTMADHETAVVTANKSAVYRDLDPESPGPDVREAVSGCANAWIVDHINDVNRARAALSELADERDFRVLLSLVAQAGLLVYRAPNPRAALELLDNIRHDGVIPSGRDAAIAMMAAGACLYEIFRAGDARGDDLARTRLVAYYDLHRRCRVDVPDDADPGELMASLAEPVGERPGFSRRTVAQLGAGAIGNWTGLALAMDGTGAGGRAARRDAPEGVRMKIFDGDEVEITNLARQVMYVDDGGDSVGRPKASSLAEELQKVDPAGTYEGVNAYVRTPDDLLPLDGTDVVLSVPDNDAARVCAADAVQEANAVRGPGKAGILFGQGGTGATGGQATVHEPGGPCFECVVGRRRASGRGGSDRCSLSQEESTIATTMIIAGMIISETREAMASRRSQNLRFVGDGLLNRFTTWPTDVECCHVTGEREARRRWTGACVSCRRRQVCSRSRASYPHRTSMPTKGNGRRLPILPTLY